MAPSSNSNCQHFCKSARKKERKKFPKIVKVKENFPCYNAVHRVEANSSNPVVLENASEIIPLMTKVLKGKLINISR